MRSTNVGSRSMARNFDPGAIRSTMAPVKAPVPGPSSTTVTGRSFGIPATIASARARELAETAPTVRGLRRNRLAISMCSRSPVSCVSGMSWLLHGLAPVLAGQQFEQAFRHLRRAVHGRDLQPVHTRAQPGGQLHGDGQGFGDVIL